jgi:hypothetical protein
MLLAIYVKKRIALRAAYEIVIRAKYFSSICEGKSERYSAELSA